MAWLFLSHDEFTPAHGSPTGLVVLGHGASGNPDAPDILALRDALVARGVTVARSVQPYAVAGRRVPAPVAQLDAAFLGLTARARELVPGVPLLVGGRSNGARVACRTAVPAGARAVVALSFPLHPPRRPDVSRADELRSAGVPALVLQGDRDPFGDPDALRTAAAEAHVLAIAGANHSPRAGIALTAAAVQAADWVLGRLRD